VYFRKRDGQSDDNQSSLDTFYVAQIAAGIFRWSDQIESELPSADDFDTFYAQHHQWLNQDAWRHYYSTHFLAQATSARFYRLPDLQDLPDSSDPLGAPRLQKGTGHLTRLPRWAYNASRTASRQPTLPAESKTQIALSTLQQTISRQRGAGYPSVSPYSETQARFWLERMGMYSARAAPKEAWRRYNFGAKVAQGWYDMWKWEAYYSRNLWDSVEARNAYLEPDLDGTRKSEVTWSGLPDGGTAFMAWTRGWDPEVGSEEEIGFLAAVAVKETEGVIEVDNLDYAMRSHMLWGVMRLAFESAERERLMEDLKRGIVKTGRIDDETKAEQWIQKVLMVMEPYVQKSDAQWPAAVEDRSELLRHILMENGQLFARWTLSPLSKEFNFELGPVGGWGDCDSRPC
jgi:hypothetical protein